MSSFFRKLIPVKREYDDTVLSSLNIRRSSHWDKIRKQFISKNGGRCAACGSIKNLNVHHIKPFHLYPLLELDESNLIVLCENKSLSCHLAFGHLLNWTAWNPDVIEDARHYSLSVSNKQYARIE